MNNKETKTEWIDILRKHNPTPRAGLPGWVLNAFQEYAQQFKSDSVQTGPVWVNYMNTESTLPKGTELVVIKWGAGDITIANRLLIIELFENGWQNIRWTPVPAESSTPSPVTEQTNKI